MSLQSLYNNLQFPMELMAAVSLFFIGTSKRKQFYVRCAFMLSVFITLCCLLSNSFAAKLIPNNVYIGMSLRYAAICLLAYFAGWFCFDCQLQRRLFAIIGGYAVQHSAYSIDRLLLLWDKALPLYRSPYYILVKYMIYAVVYCLYYRSLVRSIKWENPLPNRVYLLFLAVGTMINVLILDMNTKGFSRSQLLSFRMFSIFDCILILAVFAKLLETEQLKRDKIFMEEMSRMKEEHYQNLQESIEMTNIRCHDFKHQILELKMNTAASALQSSILDEMEQLIERYDARIETGCDALDIVLTEKMLLCQREGIQFNVIANGEALSFMAKQDIYSLFGNVTDNAIEAVRNLRDRERRVIHLSVYAAGNLLHVESSNFFEGTLDFENGLPRTTKSKKSAHGFGTKSIMYIVDKYSGDLLITANDSIYELIITIPAFKAV